MLKTFAVAVLMAIFVMPAKAQNRNVLMQNGSTTLTANETVNFYDSHGPSEFSAADGNKMRVNYWDKWYVNNEANGHGYTHTFSAPQGYDVKVVFKKFDAYGESPDGDYQSVPPVYPYNCMPIGQWALRINDDNLYAYEGTSVLASKLIGTYTGNSEDEFSIIAQEAITFKFVSNQLFREEGWAAEVTAVPHSQFVPTPPFIRRSTCSDEIELVPTTLGAAMYYSTDGSTPGIPYDSPIDWPEGSNLTVKANAILNGVSSAVTTVTFDDSNDRLITIDDDEDYMPVISRVDGENKMSIYCPAVPAGLNETFFVSYTTDGTNPSRTNGEKVYFTYVNIAGDQATYYPGRDRTYIVEWDEPNTTFKAKVFAFSCTNEHMESMMDSELFDNVYVPDPTITFTANTDPATAATTLSCSLQGVTIYYTTDGSDPTTSSTVQTYNGPFDVPAGTTVKAYATVNQTGYTPSNTVSDIYVPTNSQGEPQNGVYGGVVLLDDREDHSWSYYSDGDQPIHSLEPRDIKITYFGNSPAGRTTMTSTAESGDMPTTFSETATGVKVNHDANADQFLYLKTLEAANADGSGNYPYTMIPNPFQVRPAAEETGGGSVTETIQVVNQNGSNSYAPMYTYYANYGFKSEYIIPTSYFTNAGISAGDKLTSITLYQASTANWTATSLTIRLLNSNTGSYGNNTSFVANNGTVVYTNASYSSGNQSVHTFQFNAPFEYTGSNLVIQISSGHNGTANQTTWYGYSTTSGNRQSYYAHYASNNANTYTNDGRQRFLPNTTFTVQRETPSNKYRGFYAWRIKSLSNGLTISGKSVGDIVYADEEISFVTAKEEGNEVEFEALWAQAYVNSSTYVSNSGDYQNAYERNFKVGTTITTYNYPVTFSTLNPDGTGTLGSVTYNNIYSCSNDVKFENMTLSLGNNYFNGNNHSLIIGRGVANGNNNVAASVYGYYNANGNINGFKLRIESGRYTNAYLFYYTSARQITSSNNWKMTLGSDYDRAKGDNSKLVIAGPAEVAFRVSSSSTSAKINVLGLSGTFGLDADDNELYMGYENRSDNNTAATPRFLEVLGGNYLGGIAGGIENKVSATTHVLTMRIKGGTVHQYVYGAGQYSAAVGTRKTIITGGTYDAWVAGGCYGTDSNGNAGNTDGDSYIYFGGDANMTDTEGVFGGGYGRGDAADNKYTINKSFVVVADEAQIAGNVYGGGNKGYNTDDAEVYVLGGGKNTITVSGSVFGGANQARSEAKTTVTMEDGKVNGSLYGGANASGTVAGLATVNMSGGTVSNIFGGGLGANTAMASDVFVNVTGGTVNENVYGGGEQGVVGATGTNANTDVTIAGGTVKGSVFGAGLGTTNTVNVNNPTAPQANANIYGNTTVLVSGGTVEGSVFGGGENGSVAINVSGKKSTVGISGGTVKGSVYGGGSEGFTNGNTLVNIDGGTINGSVYGGALGKSKLVYVNGTHTVNVMGSDNGIPEIKASVYGGSRLANDGNSFTLNHNSFDNSTASQLSSVVNISGARIKEHVYASGYYGRCFGSVYVNIGTNAIDNTTVALGNNTDDKRMRKDRIFIEGTVWAGSDWGVFNGNFGAPTVTGNSNVIVDGTGYDVTSTTYTDNDYMGIGMSILGCGTSCDAGKGQRNLLVRNYGIDNLASGNVINPVNNTSRELNSIQRFKNVTFDNAHLGFNGQGRVNSLSTTEKYSIYSIVNDEFTGNVYVANGSTLVMNYPASELNSFRSVTCADTYAATPSYTVVNRDALYNSELNGTSDNKIRVNGGSFVEVKYARTSDQEFYGELQGYFHMMSSNISNEATCAYARPKQSTDSPIVSTWDNPNDGGFLSYDKQYNTWNSAGGYVGTDDYQLPYENHAPSRNDSQYFRIWRFGGNHHNVDAVVTVQQIGHSTDDDYEEYHTVDVTVLLPAWRTDSSYYRFDRVGDAGSYFTLIDYGIDVMTFNAAAYGVSPVTVDGVVQDYCNVNENGWMYYNENTEAQVTDASSSNCPEIGQLDDNPDMNYGLVILPGGAMTSHDANTSNYIICGSADGYIAEYMQYDCSDFMGMPSVTFRLTYRNNISSNTTWDPIVIPLVQCTPNGNDGEVETEYVNINLTINTMTEITSTFKTSVYAIMNGGNSLNTSTLQTIVLPTFPLQMTDNMDLSTFTLVSSQFVPAIALEGDNENGYFEDEDGTVIYNSSSSDFDINSFGLSLEAVFTPDNSDDWRDVQPEIDGGPCVENQTHTINKKIAESGGRTAVALGFHLYYSDLPRVSNVTLMGTVTFTIKFDHFANGTDSNNDGIKESTFTVEVDVYRKGPGVNFFVDGIYGKDEIDSQKDRAKYPNFSAKSVEFVLSRLGFTPGDNIFIVNQVDIKKNLKYDGSKKQNNVNIWRYPGNHPLKYDESTNQLIEFHENENNVAYRGLMFNLQSGANLTVIGTKIDGMYAEATQTNPQLYDTHIFPRPAGNEWFDGAAQAPVFNMNANSKLTFNGNTRLQNNYNAASSKAETGNAGGIYVGNDAILAMNGQTKITSNYNQVAGGVYMDGSMIVSDDVEVNLNKKSPEGDQKSNVWLTNGSGTESNVKVVQIGNANLSSFGPLTTDARIGIDKDYSNSAYMIDGYMPVVYTETANSNYVQEYLKQPFDLDNDDDLNNNIIFHDKGKYKLTKYTPDYFLYWLSTWVTFQDHEPNNQIIDGVDEGGWDGIENIHTPQQLAWFISLVNGENGSKPHTYQDTTIYINSDITMDGHIWVPVGTPTHPFMGTFEGNGHVITDMYGSLILENMGMFGKTIDATIQNVVMETNFTGTNDNLGTAVGTMNGGTLSNVEGGGKILNKLDNCNMGGLVGYNNGGTIHSGFAVADMTGGANMGGLVGKNAGNLFNSYSNIDFAKLDGQTSNMVTSGLVAENSAGCIVENCYVIEGNHSGGSFYSFARTNNGNINFCYTAKAATASLVGEGSEGTITGQGTYDVVFGRKQLGYMYYDNVVDADNDYVVDEVLYTNDNNVNVGHITRWPGLLSTLNNWVEKRNAITDQSSVYYGQNFTPWFRSTSSYLDESDAVQAYINGDLPVLGFPKDNSMGTFDNDGKFLRYGSIVDLNGIDTLITYYNENLDEVDEPAASIFLYGNATNVKNAPQTHVKAFINEDAVLLQKAGADDFNATVGVTFDNSCKNAVDFYGTKLEYDWHLMSTPLANAPMGITYDEEIAQNWWEEWDSGQVTGVSGSYMPDGINEQTDVKWDFYCYYEPQYHWINFKRNSSSHHHFDEPHEFIEYDNEENMEVGKGYMMAISQDSYLNNTGILNKEDVELTLTCSGTLPEENVGLYTKDWGSNLIGNPYQAYLDLVKVNERTGYTKFFIYDAESGIYVPYKIGQSQNSVTPSRYIHPHQAFFVLKDDDTSSESFILRYSMATTDTDSQGGSYFRGDEQVNYPLVNIFAENTQGNRDLAIIEFNRPELDGAQKINRLRNANFWISAYLENQDYGILFAPENTEKIPVHFKATEDGTYTLRWNTENGIFTSLRLVDNITGINYDMLTNDSYTFEANASDYSSRFYITYACTGIDEEEDVDNLNGNFAFFDGSEWVINGKGQLNVVDVLGRVVYSERLYNDQNRVNLNGVAKGVYLIRIADNKNVKVQKVVVR